MAPKRRRGGCGGSLIALSFFYMFKSLRVTSIESNGVGEIHDLDGFVGFQRYEVTIEGTLTHRKFGAKTHVQLTIYKDTYRKMGLEEFLKAYFKVNDVIL